MSMSGRCDLIYTICAFLFQAILIAHFALRRWRFDLAVRHGWIVYALGVSAVAASLVLLLSGKAWSLWLGGFLYLAWGAFGFVIEYVKKIQWRTPIAWPVFGPYLLLYLATSMFYWWPLALIWKPLWYAAAVLFAAGLALNLASHKNAG